MTDINEENKDLIDNTTPFGLLNHETQKRMRAWPHGFELWINSEDVPGGWTDIAFSSQFDANSEYVFRARPAPEPEPEPVEVLHEVSITVESPLLTKEMHFKLTFDAKLENATIEAIE